MTRRGEVWICPQDYVPPGRLVHRESADFWVSRQDDAALEDEVVPGAAAAVEWGRKRAEVVMIRLGHHEGSYFSAGERRPREEGIPRWPPHRPLEGWWVRPPAPTPEDVATRADRVDRGELEAAEAAAWATEQLAIFTTWLDVPTQRALVELQERAG